MKTAVVVICLLAFGSGSWGQTKPAKKFHSAPSHPHSSAPKTGNSMNTKSHEPSPLETKSVSAHQAELGRIEQQNTAQLQGKSRPSAKTSGTSPRVHSQSEGHSSGGINFNYHPPRNQARRRLSASISAAAYTRERSVVTCELGQAGSVRKRV